MPKKRYALALPLCLIALCLTGCGDTEPAPPPSTSEGGSSHAEAPADLPETLPVADLTKIQSLIVETDMQNRVLILDFWATWCAPCVAMFPGVHEGATALGTDKVRTVSITLDDASTEKPAIDFLAKHHALEDAFIIKPDSDEQIKIVDTIGPNWDTMVVPAIFVYDREGKLRGEFTGARDEAATVKEIVALAERLANE